MSEKLPWLSGVGPEMQELFEGLEEDSQKLNDPIRATMSRELTRTLQDPSPFRVYVDNAMAQRCEYGLSEKINLVHSAVLYLNELQGRKYPRDPRDAAETVKRTADICNSPISNQRTDRLLGEFTDALFYKELQTTMPARYAMAEMVMQATRDRYPQGVEVLDVGSSIGAGLKSLAHKHRTLGFPVPRVLTETGEEDQEGTIDLYLRMSQPSIFREGWCIDIKDIRDTRVQKWARANLRPAERNNPNFMQDWESLNESDPPNVHFAKLDIRNTNQVDRFMDERQNKKFHMVLGNTVFYQIARSEDDLTKVLQSIEYILEPDTGIALAQDSLKVTGNHVTDLKMTPEDWTTLWTCAAYDMQQQQPQSKAGWQELATAPNSRFDVLHLQPGTLVINGLRRTLREWISIAYEETDKFSAPTRR
jgi:hypothetical protein